MDETHDAMLAAELLHADWRKSAHSNPSGNCVELARLPARRVAVRNSRHPRGPVPSARPTRSRRSFRALKTANSTT
jgi:Domain of unknown function (DUF397)